MLSLRHRDGDRTLQRIRFSGAQAVFHPSLELGLCTRAGRRQRAVRRGSSIESPVPGPSPRRLPEPPLPRRSSQRRKERPVRTSSPSGVKPPWKSRWGGGCWCTVLTLAAFIAAFSIEFTFDDRAVRLLVVDRSQSPAPGQLHRLQCARRSPEWYAAYSQPSPGHGWSRERV